MRRFTAMVVLLFAVCVTGVVGQTAPVSEADAVRTVLTADPVPADLFAASFLAQVPVSKIIPIREQVTAALGTLLRAEGANGQYVAYYTRGTVKVFIHLDAQGKIDSLFLREPMFSSMDDALKPLESLPGTVSYVVIKNGQEIASFHQDRALGVGSTFKLAVLNALRQQIDAGKRHWTDVVKLQPGWKSLPSGILQSWPDGSPLTLATLATEMISISDNTAADSLIHVVGRQAIRPYGGSNVPFLTTRELFQIKSTNNEAVRSRYRTGDARQRAAVLSELDKQPLPDFAHLDQSPALDDIEWHFTNRDLCDLMRGVYDLPLMTVSPGVANPLQWKRIAYKGGKDWGVLSMTTWLEAKDGTRYCVSATWNNSASAVDETAFGSQYGLLLSTLAGMK